MLKFYFFGKGKADYDGRPLASFPSQQSYLLLCFLILHPHYAHPREQLASLFWGDYPTHVSRKYLRNNLWRLRQAFDAVGVPHDRYLLVDDESVAFINLSDYWLDVREFETAVVRYQDLPGPALTPEQVSGLEVAVDLYTADLLTGTYEDWCLYERERLSMLYVSTLDKLMTFHEKHGTYERGLAYGERLLARDNTREKVHLQMMRLFWQLGDRSAALEQYRRCASILKEELGIAPMRETTAVYQQMVNNTYHYSPHPPHSITIKKNGLLIERAAAGERLTNLTPEYALQKIQVLQRVIEDATAELRQIEQMVLASMADSKP